MYPVVSDGCDVGLPEHQTLDLYRLAALSAWRMTQGGYQFDPDVFEAIADTLVTGALPHEILFRLPERAVYVETPGLLYAGDPLHGFFAHLDATLDTGAAQLRLLLDAEDALDPFALPLGPWPLAESIARVLASTGTDAAQSAPAAAGAGIRAVIEPLVLLLLYLCSQAAETSDATNRPSNPQPKKAKWGLRLFQAEQPRNPGDGTHPGSSAHIRRAH
ncbi:hypothetical protein [Azohydromonas australica]|uniref:hypothetical protein n=1 Tax=Azohydromonas australica TaxID=364039 RepID=UPI000688D548|nr:hypothetical protein [Azohydromonas australica]